MLLQDSQGFCIQEFSEPLVQIENEIKLHAVEKLNSESKFNFDDSFKTIVKNHHRFKNKSDRLLTKKATERLIPKLEDWCQNIGIDLEFITDEENLGYPNIYFRVVRPFAQNDVGSIHADRWFWDTAKNLFPIGYRRLKLWAPLLQNDSEPSLALLPGSHLENYEYGTKTGCDGKPRPFLGNNQKIGDLLPAPVKTGQCVIFHDSLLHQGRATNSPRISVEFTMALKKGNEPFH